MFFGAGDLDGVTLTDAGNDQKGIDDTSEDLTDKETGTEHESKADHTADGAENLGNTVADVLNGVAEVFQFDQKPILHGDSPSQP